MSIIIIIVAAAAESRVARGPVDWGAWLLRFYGLGRFQEPTARQASTELSQQKSNTDAVR